LFRTEFGARITEYLQSLRLEKAQFLLKHSDIPIAKVAELVGISSQQYLSRLFHKHVGKTPQEYRRSYNITCNYANVRYEMEPSQGEPPHGDPRRDERSEKV
jgi:AraC-like DNA-binding protein